MQYWHNKITDLSLVNCDLKELPPEIGELQNLTELDLDKNQLSALPPEIGNLQNLGWLHLAKNQLNQFPKVLLDLNLRVKWSLFIFYQGIQIKNNPFHTPPVEIVKQGRQAIIDYYTAL